MFNYLTKVKDILIHCSDNSRGIFSLRLYGDSLLSTQLFANSLIPGKPKEINLDCIKLQ